MSAVGAIGRLWLSRGTYVLGVVVSIAVCISCGGSAPSQNSVVSGVGTGAPSPPSPPSIADATTNMIVADAGSHRVLIFRGPFTSRQTPAVVIGQPDLISASPGRSSRQLRNPYNAILDATGDLWVSDTFNDRILEFVPPFANALSASLVLGQPDFTSDNFNLSGPKTSVGLAHPEGLTFDKLGNLWVADSYDNRVVEFAPPFQNGMAFSLEMKQLQQDGPGDAVMCRRRFAAVGIFCRFSFFQPFFDFGSKIPGTCLSAKRFPFASNVPA